MITITFQPKHHLIRWPVVFCAVASVLSLEPGELKNLIHSVRIRVPAKMDCDSVDRNVEMWRIKRLIKSLELARG